MLHINLASNTTLFIISGVLIVRPFPVLSQDYLIISLRNYISNKAEINQRVYI